MICGLQKMTLLDFPGKIACTVFLGGCNFRCPFCHNSELFMGKPEKLMENEEFLPKQLTFENGVIPNQVHLKELKKILKNAESYLPFLKETDENAQDVINRHRQIVQLINMSITHL